MEKTMICDVCKKRKAHEVIPHTVTVKEDVYSETLKETLKQGTRITVHLAVCTECQIEEIEVNDE